MERTKLELAIYADGRQAQEIASLSKISAVSLCNIAKGRQVARLETAMRISDVLGKKPEELGLVTIREACGYGA